MRPTDTGTCESCGHTFQYWLIHNGFNDSAFAYCDRCGCEASLSGWYDRIPPHAHLKIHGPVNPEAVALLQPCSCGGCISRERIAPLSALQVSTISGGGSFVPGGERPWHG